MTPNPRHPPKPAPSKPADVHFESQAFSKLHFSQNVPQSTPEHQFNKTHHSKPNPSNLSDIGQPGPDHPLNQTLNHHKFFRTAPKPPMILKRLKPRPISIPPTKPNN
jgi:hypothetical protein